MACREASSRAVLLTVAFLLALLQTACASYAARMESAMNRVQAADYEGAFEVVDRLVQRAEEGRRPEKFDLPLLLLERASIAQLLGDHERALADLRGADEMLELLDLTPDGFATTARYLWSDDLTLYRPPIYEKLLVNLMAMASYLHLGRVNSAVVEARRARVLIDFFRQGELDDHPMIGAALYLSAIAFELNGETESAMRMYAEAWRRGQAPGLAESIARLGPQVRRIAPAVYDEAVAQVGDLEEGDAEIIVLLFAGLGPRRVPEYFPIGAVYAWVATSGWQPMTADDHRRYNEIVAKGLLSWINFPVLERFNNPSRSYQVLARDSGGALRRSAVPVVADIESFALAEWESQRGAIAAAAITRAITRIVAREVTEGVARGAGLDDRLFPGASLIAGLLVQGAMQASDRPDTRNWTTLPATVRVARMRVPAGRHNVEVVPLSAGARGAYQVDVPAGGQRVVTLRAIH